VARTWTATIRAATQRSPRALLPAALELPGAEGRLAAGIVALLGGDLGAAATLLREAGDHPDADVGVVAPAACASRVVGLLTGAGDPDSDLEALMLDVEMSGWPWLSRIGRALLALDSPGPAPAAPGDPWGAAVVAFVDGLGRRAAGPLMEAAARFTELGAPIPAHWASCLAAAIGRPADSAAAVARARGAGLRDLPIVVDGWAGTTGPPAVPLPRAAPVPASPLTLRLLGRTEIAIDGVAVDLSAVRPRARSTLRLLALRAGDAVHRDVLAASLWPDADEEAALRSLQVAISSLRSVLGGRGRGRPTLLGRSGESYCLALPPGSSSDVRDFEARLAEARARRFDGDAAGERAALTAALGHYGGDLLPEEGPAEWVVAERDRLRLTAAGAWCVLGRRLGDDGEFAEGVDAVRASLRLDGYSDDAWRLLIDLHTRAGNPAAAQAAALEHGQVLAELGVEPAEPEVRAAQS
jgi:DNA-binding SARP family transcriptional activator